MGMRLIDADALANALFEKRRDYPQWVADTIGGMQEAVVRCKDCKWNSGTAEKPFCMMRSVPSPADWFCADGEQKK